MNLFITRIRICLFSSLLFYLNCMEKHYPTNANWTIRASITFPFFQNNIVYYGSFVDPDTAFGGKYFQQICKTPFYHQNTDLFPALLLYKKTMEKKHPSNAFWTPPRHHHTSFLPKQYCVLRLVRGSWYGLFWETLSPNWLTKFAKHRFITRIKIAFSLAVILPKFYWKNQPGKDK